MHFLAHHYTKSSKYKQKKSHLSKELVKKNLYCSPTNAHTIVTAGSSEGRLLPASHSIVLKKNNFRREKEKKSHTNPNFPSEFFFWRVWSFNFWTYWFSKYFMKNLIKLIFPKKCGFWPQKGSNVHLNTVLGGGKEIWATLNDKYCYAFFGGMASF